MEVQTQEKPMPPLFMNFREISDDLIARIRAGEYAPGDRLPSYKELAKMYTVGVTTASRAYGRLKDLGWVQGVHAHGVYVADPLPK